MAAMTTGTDSKTGKISVSNITEDQLEKLSELAEKEASKPRLPQKFKDILDMNYPILREIIDNRGYKSLQAVLLESLEIDVSINTLRQYMSELSKQYSDVLKKDNKKKTKKKSKSANKQHVETSQDDHPKVSGNASNSTGGIKEDLVNELDNLPAATIESSQKSKQPILPKPSNEELTTMY